MTDVDLNGLTLSVTPIDEMPPHRQMTGAVLISRLQSALSRKDFEAVEDAAVDFLQFVVDEPLTKRTIAELDSDELDAIHQVVMDDGGDDDGR